MVRTTSCCCCATDTLLSHDDHPVLDVVAQEHGKDSKLSSSLPHRCIRLSACILSFVFPLSSACSCASTSCRSSSHCVSWLSESSTSVLSANVLRRNTYFHLVLQRVCMSSRHRGQLSLAVEVVTNSSRSGLVFTKALLSCVPWSSRDCSDNSTGSHIFDSAWRLSSQRCVSTAQQYSRSAHPGTLHHSSLMYATRPVPSWPPQPSLSTRWTTCEQSHQMHC